MATESIFDPTYDFIGKESDVEDHIIENLDDISKYSKWGEISRVEKQWVMPFGKTFIKADIMIWHNDGTGTVIEVKRTKTNKNDIISGISQLMSYGYKMKTMLGAMPRMVLAAPTINEDVADVIKEFNLPIELMMIDGDRVVYLKNAA